MRTSAAFVLLPLVLAGPVTAVRADTLPGPHHRQHARPVSSAEAPVVRPAPQAVTVTPPSAVPTPPAQFAAPAPVVAPAAKPPAQTIGVVGVPPTPNQTR